MHSDYSILSELTIALLEDSGWYKANYTALYELNQHPLLWGKGVSSWFVFRIFMYMQYFDVQYNAYSHSIW